MAPKRRAPSFTDGPVDVELMAEIEAFAAVARKLVFPKRGPRTPGAVVEGLSDWVDRLRSGEEPAGEIDPSELVMGLACLWGGALATAVGWEWRDVRWKDGHGVGLVPPGREYVVYPLPVVTRILEVPEADNVLCELFALVQSGSLPPSKKGLYASLS